LPRIRDPAPHFRKPPQLNKWGVPHINPQGRHLGFSSTMASQSTSQTIVGVFKDVYPNIDPSTDETDTFKGKVVYVSGASSGIGKETALAFSQMVASVAFADWCEAATKRRLRRLRSLEIGLLLWAGMLRNLRTQSRCTRRRRQTHLYLVEGTNNYCNLSNSQAGIMDDPYSTAYSISRLPACTCALLASGKVLETLLM
jgi:hypothetical protein